MRNQGLGPSPSPGVRDMGARGLTPLGQRFCVQQNRFERRRRRRQASPSRGRVPPTPVTHHIVRNTCAMRALLMGSHRSFVGPINLRIELSAYTRTENHNIVRISPYNALTPTRKDMREQTKGEGT